MRRTKKILFQISVMVVLLVPYVINAQASAEGFTAVAGTDKAVVDRRKSNNTALAVTAGVGTVVLFAIGLTATKKKPEPEN